MRCERLVGTGCASSGLEALHLTVFIPLLVPPGGTGVCSAWLAVSLIVIACEAPGRIRDPDGSSAGAA